MVLTTRSIMPGAVICALGALVVSGCNESLFGAHHSTTVDAAGGIDGEIVPGVCTAPCVADAGAEFDGTAGGLHGHWRYLDDARSPQRTWNPMTVGTGEMRGADPKNRVTSCALHSDAPACTALPGALLISSSGASSAADPAIEFKAPTGQVIKLSLHAFVPAGDDQTIRMYRNSREDVLFTKLAMAGTAIADEITVDALPGDRFLVAVAPTGNGAADVGIQLFVTDAGKPFPSSCQLALRFDDVASGNSVTDLLCLGDAFTHLKATGTTAQIFQTPAPYILLGSSGRVEGGTYLHEFANMRPIDYSGDVTVQLWANLASFVGGGRASVFSDLGSSGGGVELAILPGPPEMVTVTTRTATATVQIQGNHPPIGAWHFLRVVRTAANLRVCVDGALAATMDTTPFRGPASHLPDLGKDLVLPMDQASFDGELDDVRALTGALPCE